MDGKEREKKTLKTGPWTPFYRLLDWHKRAEMRAGARRGGLALTWRAGQSDVVSTTPLEGGSARAEIGCIVVLMPH
jgi:hypothetical protein